MVASRTDRKILIFGIFLVFLWVLLPFVQSLCLAMLVSTVLAKPVDRLQSVLRLSRVVAALIVSFLFSAGILVPLIIMLIFVGKEIIGVSADVEGFLLSRNWFEGDLIGYVRDHLVTSGVDLQDKLRGFLGEIASGAAAFLGRWAGAVPQLVLDLFIFEITLFYVLVSKEQLRLIFQDLLPLDKQEFAEFSQATVGIFRGVIGGTLLAGLVQGTLIGLGYWIFGVPKPLLFASLTAFLALIPLLGTGPTGIGGAVYLFANGDVVGGIGMLVIFGVASFSDNLIKPFVLKGTMEMHPLLALLGALGGLAVFGFIGLFLGPLVVALAVISLKLYRHHQDLKV